MFMAAEAVWTGIVSGKFPEKPPQVSSSPADSGSRTTIAEGTPGKLVVIISSAALSIIF